MYDIKSIIRAIREGVNPITGEIFDKKILSEDISISEEILKLASETIEGITNSKKQEPQKALPEDAKMLFKGLKAWRTGEAMKQQVPAYIVFTDKTLLEVAISDISKKEELLSVKGIGPKKYEKYGDDLYSIIKSFEGNVTAEPKKKTEVQSPKSTGHHKPLPKLTNEQIEKFPFSKKWSLYISDIVRYINVDRDATVYRAVKYSDIADWLKKEGYMTEYVDENGLKHKEATEKGRAAGFCNEERLSSKGEYTIVICRYNAQRVIVDNFNIIAGHETAKPVKVVEPAEIQDKKQLPKESQATCKKCMLYRNDTCFGEKQICSFYKPSVDIPANEKAMWPKEMAGREAREERCRRDRLKKRNPFSWR